MMYRSVLIVLLLLCVCGLEGQFRIPLLSRFLPSRSPITPSSRILIPPPSPPSPRQSNLQLALSPRQPHALEGLGLRVPPPPPREVFNASPKFEEGPLRVLEVDGLDEGRQPSSFRGIEVAASVDFGRELISEDSTSPPFAATPTTIKFTLDDVPEFLEPSLFSTQSNKDFSASSLEGDSLSILDNPLDLVDQHDDDGDDSDEDNILPTLRSSNSQQHLFILTSTENAPDSSTLRPSTSFSILQQSGSSFRPSFSLPFLDNFPEQEPQNLFTLVETRNPRVSSFLRSEAPHFLESRPKIFALKPVKVESEEVFEEQVAQEPNHDRTLSKTPVPKPIHFSEEVIEEEEEKESVVETSTKADKPIPTRKTFHFEQEFLSLLKKNNPIEKSQPHNSQTSFHPNPFWFSEQSERNSGVWRLKGGVRSPSLDLVPQDSVVSQIALKNSLGGVFATSIRGLSTPTLIFDESLKILEDDFGDFEKTPGITVKSLAQGGLSRDLIEEEEDRTTVTSVTHRHNVSEASLKLENDFDRTTIPGAVSHGPQIVPVAEVGEVTHATYGATISPVPAAAALSAAIKHGVQSLNVTAWVSGCPKLYGKAELNCVVEHDAIGNTAMTLMWKKKSFTEGRPQEHIMTENDLLKMEDSRFSLHHHHDRYVLSIKDFRPKDCGTYECEAKAADTRASSQLLLFTCL